MSMRRILLLLLAVPALSLLACAQSLADLGDFPGAVARTISAQRDLTYVRPTEKTRLHNYVFDAFGPHPTVGPAIAAGINPANNSPPEWGQGAAGYARRFGSDFGIAAVTTTTRYTLVHVFHEDTLYYRRECKGVLPRPRDALISIFTGRRGEDGHRVFSFPALIAPYAGTMTAVYAWYPKRYDAEDAFRMGNYSLLAYAAQNVGLEFIYSGPHSLLPRMHLNNGRRAPDPGTIPGANL
jgi:hypothetical protein